MPLRTKPYLQIAPQVTFHIPALNLMEFVCYTHTTCKDNIYPIALWRIELEDFYSAIYANCNQQQITHVRRIQPHYTQRHFSIFASELY